MTGICVECLAEVEIGKDCEKCGSGYYLTLEATIRELLAARKMVEEDELTDA